MKKILYFHGNSDIIGGTETFLENVILHHKELIPYIMFTKGGILPERIKKSGFKNVFILSEGSKMPPFYAMPALMYKVVQFVKHNEIDYMVGQGISSLEQYCMFSWAASTFANVKRVYYLRNIKEYFSPRIRRFFLWSCTPMLFVNSHATRAGIEKNLRINTPVEVVYPGIDTAKFSVKKISGLNKEFNIPADAKVVSIISRIKKWKGQDCFIQAASAVLRSEPETYFLIVGEASSEADKIYRKALIKRVETYGIQDRVIFTGFRSDIPDILNLSTVVVAPSIEPEPFGRSIVEAMASSKPVVATAIGGPLEIINSETDGILVPPEDAEAIQSAVVRLLRDQNLRNAMGEKARIKVIENFSVTACVSKIESLLKTL